jgi:hypothetical protein
MRVVSLSAITLAKSVQPCRTDSRIDFWDIYEKRHNHLLDGQIGNPLQRPDNLFGLVALSFD